VEIQAMMGIKDNKDQWVHLAQRGIKAIKVCGLIILYFN
jgi:hypothetical protein